MPDQYPYIISNNKIEPILARIRTAAKPDKLGQELIATWGFTASNDRAMPRVLKSLGFLAESGAPTPYYDRLRDPNDWQLVLGERIKDTYSDLFAIDSNIHKSSETEIKGAMSRITGKDEESVKRYFATFKTLVSLAKINNDAASSIPEIKNPAAPPPQEPPASIPPAHRKSEYHYNIQIHLPVTTDITVYNAIFKSLRENLGV
ncbi:hypothetical protein GALL_06350 [mine drainage metagenome]|uniref:DUF5343 domain-containing protein n=1 Tax=mine drainage metagenome TaxID=410659 RepID=A0A1J5TFR0_9ZZZZ